MKHQAACYRTIAGQRYINACDVPSPIEDAIVAQVKAKHIPHRLFRHPEGFQRLFVLESRFPEIHT